MGIVRSVYTGPSVYLSLYFHKCLRLLSVSYSVHCTIISATPQYYEACSGSEQQKYKGMASMLHADIDIQVEKCTPLPTPSQITACEDSPCVDFKTICELMLAQRKNVEEKE